MATYAAKGDRLQDRTVEPRSMRAINGKGSTIGLSDFWNDCPLVETLVNPAVGWGIQDDFTDCGESGTITTIINSGGFGGKYKLFGSTGATIAAGDVQGGGVVLTNDTTDNDQVSITSNQLPFQITSGAGSLWFEARLKISSITTEVLSIVAGLNDDTAQTAVVPMLANTGLLADHNFVGFNKPNVDTTTLNCSYRANGVAEVEVNGAVGTLAADTYIKLGMKFDTGANELMFYINGVQQATSKTVPNASGTDFPADVRLSPVFSVHNGTTGASILTVDWFKCFQARA